MKATAAKPPAQPVQLKASGSARMPAPIDELTRVSTDECAEAPGASSTTTVAMVQAIRPRPGSLQGAARAGRERRRRERRRLGLGGSGGEAVDLRVPTAYARP